MGRPPVTVEEMFSSKFATDEEWNQFMNRRYKEMREFMKEDDDHRASCQDCKNLKFGRCPKGENILEDCWASQTEWLQRTREVGE